MSLIVQQVEVVSQLLKSCPIPLYPMVMELTQVVETLLNYLNIYIDDLAE